MSYILDALRRSERERQQAEPLVLNAVGADAVELPRSRVVPTVAAVALVVGTILALGGYWVLQVRRSVTLPVAAQSSVTAHESAAGAPATVAKVGDHGVPKIRPAPELQPNPFVAGRLSSSVRDLAGEARVRSSGGQGRVAPAVRTQAAEETNASLQPVVAAPVTEAAIKFLRAMPSEFQRALPKLTVTIHIYAPREADRILYINNHQYHAGDRVGDGVVVKEIVQDGAVLSFRGQLFKLPRPT